MKTVLFLQLNDHGEDLLGFLFLYDDEDDDDVAVLLLEEKLLLLGIFGWSFHYLGVVGFGERVA